jgi:hypothetical protein
MDARMLPGERHLKIDGRLPPVERGRLKIAHRFIGGNELDNDSESVKRTNEMPEWMKDRDEHIHACSLVNPGNSAVRYTDS